MHGCGDLRRDWNAIYVPECKQEPLVTVEILKPTNPWVPPYRVAVEDTNSVNVGISETIHDKERCGIHTVPGNLRVTTKGESAKKDR